jgi:hypothetical protein
MQSILPIIALAALCAGWVAVQLLAKKMKTKNHFDDLDGSTCGSCTCGGIGNKCHNGKHE